MINIFEVNETNKMIEQENLDVRTITMGISLLDCIDSDLEKMNEKIYEKITTRARDLVGTGDKISMEYGIPIVNKRISWEQVIRFPWNTAFRSSTNEFQSHRLL